MNKFLVCLIPNNKFLIICKLPNNSHVSIRLRCAHQRDSMTLPIVYTAGILPFHKSQLRADKKRILLEKQLFRDHKN